MFQMTAVLGLAVVGCSAARFPNASKDRPVIPLEGMLVLAVVALVVSVAASRAIKQPVPPLIQRYVKTGILSLVWLHVGVVAAVRGPELALAIAALWLPAFILGRWLYST
jgi:4-hydroxybenzoate polyprenyltransferase